MRNQPVREAMNGFNQLGKILRKLIECEFFMHFGERKMHILSNGW